MKIVIVACDLYADAAPAWLHLLRKNWRNCPYEPVFVTNSRKLNVDAPVTYIEGRDIEFGWRFRKFIEDEYHESHLLFMMVDYFIKYVDERMVNVCADLCRQPDIVHVRLRPMPHPQHPYKVDGIGLIEKGSRYSLSLQPGIWETQALYHLCRDEDNPYQTEIQGSGRTRRAPGTFLSVDKVPAIAHHNYYRKGHAQGLKWVKANVHPRCWPAAVKKKYRKRKK